MSMFSHFISRTVFGFTFTETHQTLSFAIYLDSHKTTTRRYRVIMRWARVSWQIMKEPVFNAFGFYTNY
jgi:hypothetical protein